MSELRIGSLFSGYGGLDLGVMAALGGSVAWHVEFDAAPSRILDHHWPEVPNYGDVTAVDWAAVEPVDILTGGFPCQDLSHAGKRKGLRPGTRSGLWEHMAYAIDQLRPQLVVIENVRGLLSASAHSDLEPCPWCVGGSSDGEPALRALGAVLGSLAELGYDARWLGLRAADAGAPHGRFRVFIVAHPADADRMRPRPRSGARDSAPDGVRISTGIGNGDPAHNGVTLLPTPTAVTRDRSPEESEMRFGPDGTRAGRGMNLDDMIPLLPTPTAHVHPAHDSLDPHKRIEGDHQTELTDVVRVLPMRADFGPYAPAITRWENTLGRPAPSPTEPGKDGRPRLSPLFVEWMMGLPAGHVTSPEIGLTRAQALKACGNGVVPQQAEAALRMLLGLERTSHQWHTPIPCSIQLCGRDA